MHWAEAQLVVSRAFVTIVVVGLVSPVSVSPASLQSSLQPSPSAWGLARVGGWRVLRPVFGCGRYDRACGQQVGVVAGSCVSRRHGIGAGGAFARRGGGWRWRWTCIDEGIEVVRSRPRGDVAM
ncbi:hypothetical protein EDB84DRAFT_1152010 [Lactarius hengduanensis]|nr:hypothetical protein EDB84DRAFT_1152010 [Lactarius hengduanensis]